MPADNHDSRPPRSILLHNIFNYGHYLVYASVLTRWALSRGLSVHMMGRGVSDSPYGLRFSGHPLVTLHDAGREVRFPTPESASSKPALLRECLESLLSLQRALRPDFTLLLSADDYLFEDIGVHEPSFRFEAPTHAMITFGNREHYTAFADVHAARLREILFRRTPFAGLFTLDEYHPTDTGACADALFFMPDIFREDPPSGPVSPAGLALARFLDAGTGPVIPVIGKFDLRKNNLWVIEAARDTPGATCVVCGERLPGPDDRRIDAALAQLRARGRLFESYGYVSEELFHVALGHERTRFLPLPYINHYGSSGVQLLGFSHAKPSLVPSGGLMARRVEDHGLGMVYKAQDKADFLRRFRDLAESGPAPYRKNCSEFMAVFGDKSRADRLDRAFGLAQGRAAPGDDFPGAKARPKPEHIALTLFWRKGDRDERKILEQLDKFDPDDQFAQFRKARMLIDLDRRNEAKHIVRRGLAMGAVQEFDAIFIPYVEKVLDKAETLLNQGDNERATRLARDLLDFLPDNHPRGPVLARLPAADRVRQAGVVMAWIGEHLLAADCFRETIAREPDAYDVYLNLSDVLRYVKQYPQSLETLDRLERAAPGWPGISHKRGQVLFETGERDMALKRFLREPEDSRHREAAMAYAERILKGLP